MSVKLVVWATVLALAPHPVLAQLELTNLTGRLTLPVVLDQPCDNYCSPDLVACESLALHRVPSEDSPAIGTLNAGDSLELLEGRRAIIPGTVVVRKDVLNEEHYDPDLWLAYPWMPQLASRSWMPGDTIRPVAWVSDGDGSGAWLWWTGTEFGSGSDFWVSRRLADRRAEEARDGGTLAVMEVAPTQTEWVLVETRTGQQGWVIHTRDGIWGRAGYYEERGGCDGTIQPWYVIW